MRSGSVSFRVATRGRGRWTRFGTVAVRVAGHAPDGGLLVVDVEVHNGSDRPLLLSPDQFRLRSGGDPAIPYKMAGWPGDHLAAGGTLRSWVGFRMPFGADDPWIEYQEPGAIAAHAFPIELAPAGLQVIT